MCPQLYIIRIQCDRHSPILINISMHFCPSKSLSHLHLCQQYVSKVTILYLIIFPEDLLTSTLRNKFLPASVVIFRISSYLGITSYLYLAIASEIRTYLTLYCIINTFQTPHYIVNSNLPQYCSLKILSIPQYCQLTTLQTYFNIAFKFPSYI